MDADITDRLTLEAVIDVASRRPRVAYLRDVTLLPIAAMQYARLERQREPEERGAPGDLDRVERMPEPVGPPEDAGIMNVGADLKISTGLGMGFDDEEAPGEPAATRPDQVADAESDSSGSTRAAPDRSRAEAVDRRRGRWRPAGGAP